MASLGYSSNAISHFNDCTDFNSSRLRMIDLVKVNFGVWTNLSSDTPKNVGAIKTATAPSAKLLILKA